METKTLEVVGLMLLLVGGSISMSSLFVLVYPVWLVQLIVGVGIMLLGLAVILVYAVRVLRDSMSVGDTGTLSPR